MDSTIKREEDGTIVLEITIPQKDIKKTQEEVVEDTTKSADIPGFRKGKAPKKVVEQKLDKDSIKEEVLRKLLPIAYSEAIKKHDIKPILNPKIHVEALEEGKDWKFTATTCEIPEVDLNGYKENIKKVTAKGKIIVPGKEQKDEVSLDEILKSLSESVNIKASRIIVEQEVERLLAQTLDEIKRLGLTLDQYLSSTKRTAEDLRREYEAKALNDIKLEFAMAKIAEEEKIIVSDSDIDGAVKNAKDENERKSLESNRYLLASIIRQRKTLDFLRGL
jgi:FKBP-type peptidyl-prolyl cis-trans isomerase (trigger factor)